MIDVIIDLSHDLLTTNKQNRLFVYAIDELFTTLRPRGSEFDVYSLSDGGIGSEIECVGLIPGKEEVVLVDTAGLSRVLSLVTEKFRYVGTLFVQPLLTDGETDRQGSVRLPEGTHSILCSPDGSCVFLTTTQLSGEVTSVKACHTESFGTVPGVDLDISAEAIFSPEITSFVTRNNIYLVYPSSRSTNLHSVKVQVTTRASDFTIKAQYSPARKSSPSTTLMPNSKHNCLLDCYSDVWGRYPIVATIERANPELLAAPRSLSFVTSRYEKPFRDYIEDMVKHFEKQTQKPTNGLLSDIQVSAVPDASVVIEGTIPERSTYPAGKWLIELLCLIPLHLAVADGNSFVPLKDGLRSSDFERSLLGLNHVQVADR